MGRASLDLSRTTASLYRFSTAMTRLTRSRGRHIHDGPIMGVSAFPVIVGHGSSSWCPSASFRSDDGRILFRAGKTELHGGSGSKTGRRTAGSHGGQTRDGQREALWVDGPAARPQG